MLVSHLGTDWTVVTFLCCGHPAPRPRKQVDNEDVGCFEPHPTNPIGGMNVGVHLTNTEE